VASQRIIKAVFIERDGILCENDTSTKSGKRSPRTFEDFKLIREAKVELERLKKAGFLIIVTTHQSGITNGHLTRSELDRMHEVLRTYFGVLTDIMVCTHGHEDACPCKKPLPGLVREAQQRHQIHLPYSFVISDDARDDTLAKATGCYSIQIRSAYNTKINPLTLVATVTEGVDKILRINKTRFGAS
jgi:D-glycero-D-manno-heptose 1,7-bisphosphate phosphatase